MGRSISERHSGAREARTRNPSSHMCVDKWIPGFDASHRPGMTAVALRRADPVAVKTIGHAMAEMHQRHRTCLDILRVEHREVTAVLLRAPDGGEQPAIALGRISATFDKYRLRNGVAGGQQIVAEPFAFAVDM